MSQRLGMADGRCFTVNTSNQLLNNYIMKQNGISFEDNYSFRKMLQEKNFLNPYKIYRVPTNVGRVIKHFSKYQTFTKWVR